MNYQIIYLRLYICIEFSKGSNPPDYNLLLIILFINNLPISKKIFFCIFINITNKQKTKSFFYMFVNVKKNKNKRI